jgi:hypothetical protein
LTPGDNADHPADAHLDFTWSGIEDAAFYRLEIHDVQDKLILSAMLLPAIRTYRAPSWLKDKIGDGVVQWRVVGLDKSGKQVSESQTRRFRMNK